MTIVPFDPNKPGSNRPPEHPAIAGAPRGSLNVTITYLEMDERPSGAPIPAPHKSQVALMRAIEPTISFYRYLYDTVGGPWLWYERRRMATAVLRETITDYRVEILVLYVAGVPAGFAELDRRKPNVTDLAYFGLIPDFIGRRLGPFLLDAAIRRAWDGDIGKLTVNTCTLDHASALPMYQRSGFEPVRQELKVIKDPRVIGDMPTDCGSQIPLRD
ncbi:MAG: GNAT family N-acetyltransferase [Alphaproteobacteria bacterium]|nr:GNAT family N-acetyltransferase [Alphaproteobacteria bacterium SS10]